MLWSRQEPQFFSCACWAHVFPCLVLLAILLSGVTVIATEPVLIPSIIPLTAFCQRVYGARCPAQFAAQVGRLNYWRRNSTDPLLVPTLAELNVTPPQNVLQDGLAYVWIRCSELQPLHDNAARHGIIAVRDLTDSWRLQLCKRSSADEAVVLIADARNPFALVRYADMSGGLAYIEAFTLPDSNRSIVSHLTLGDLLDELRALDP